MSDQDPTFNDPDAPEDAITVTQPDPPGYVGTLEPDEFQRLRQLQQASNQAVMQLGQLEVRKHNILQSIVSADAQAQALMNQAADRFGTAPNQKWNVGPDRKVFVMEG